MSLVTLFNRVEFSSSLNFLDAHLLRLDCFNLRVRHNLQILRQKPFTDYGSSFVANSAHRTLSATHVASEVECFKKILYIHRRKAMKRIAKHLRILLEKPFLVALATLWCRKFVIIGNSNTSLNLFQDRSHECDKHVSLLRFSWSIIVGLDAFFK
jgi:hypothetical protein